MTREQMAALMTRRTAAAMANSGRIAEDLGALIAERDALRAKVNDARGLALDAIAQSEESLARVFGGAPFPALVSADQLLAVLTDDSMPPEIADRLAAVVQAEVERRG